MTTRNDQLPAAVVRRKAVVYVRQSSSQQVQQNLESQRRQYELVEVARRAGFAEIEVIDDDLGRSASGAVARPGFERLVAALCAGEVGAVLCLEASRLARNGRDWHHLLELCGLVEARVIDLDGIYDPCHPNDRLLLGMKGSISEFELGINLADKPHLAAAATICHGHCVAEFCDINPDVNFCMLLHGPPSCAEDRLGHSEQPSKAQCRASHSGSADIRSYYSLTRPDKEIASAIASRAV